MCERQMAAILEQVGLPGRSVRKVSILYTQPGAVAGRWHADVPQEAHAHA